MWRKAWADIPNAYLERAESRSRIDHRSNAERGISTLAELDAALSSVSDQADAIRAGMKTAEKRMKKLMLYHKS